MRYISLIFFACFLVFCVDFATQNTDQIILIYKLEWLNFIFKTERPVFVHKSLVPLRDVDFETLVNDPSQLNLWNNACDSGVCGI